MIKSLISTLFRKKAAPTHVPTALSRHAVAVDIGAIENPEDFGKRHSRLYNAYEVFSVWLDIPDIHAGQIDIPQGYLPEQFYPAIEQAVADYAAQFPDKQSVSIELFANQGSYKDEGNITIPGIHIDASLSSYPQTDKQIFTQYIVSDCIPTRFYNQSFTLPEKFDEPLSLPLSDSIYTALSKVFRDQACEEAVMTPPPFHMVRYDSFTVHEAQEAVGDGQRTMLLLNCHDKRL